MPTFKITVCRHWKEFGEMTIEADDANDAREKARDALSEGDDGIEWNEGMDPENDDIEDCVEQ